MNAREKVAKLRKLMKKNGVDAYYIPSTDQHQSEYLPDCWKYRAWFSGFTGSAGDVVVSQKKAGLWTDGRYFIQADAELADSPLDLMKMGEPGTPDMPTWVAGQLKKGQALGIDPSVISVAAAKVFEQALTDHGIKVKFFTPNLVDKLWTDRPDPSLSPIKLHSTKFAGETVTSKLKRLRASMKDAGTTVHVIGALDQIAWLFNIRSADIAFTPVVISYAVITATAATLYVDPRKVTKGIVKSLKGNVKIKDYDVVWQDLAAIPAKKAKKKDKVWIDPVTTNRRIVDTLAGVEFHYESSPITAMKAVKNAVQIACITKAHVRDGVAMVKFLKWLEAAVPAGGVTEIGASDKLTGFRAEDKTYMDNSFGSISGYAGNGAMCHYSATEESNAKIKPKGIYLIDSGGQYPEGTTDITRTVALSKPSKRQIECFTRVLMGTIDCTVIPFPAGTSGQRHEMFARRALWMIGEDYPHGTGHGVGQYLGVHEGPHSLKNLVTPPLVEGNLLSIEPGHYEAGKFGIRIENLAFVTKDEKLSSPEKTWLRFKDVTLCPIDRNLIDKKYMSPDQIKYLNKYHKQVFVELSPLLDKEHQVWLKKACKAI